MSQIFYKYLPLIPKAHSTPHDRMQELVHAIEGLDLDLLQHIVGKAIVKHGLGLGPKSDKIQYHDQKEPETQSFTFRSRRCVTGQSSNGTTC